MKIVSTLKLELENFEKCALICDNDTSLGVLYDYACALQSFLLNKMKEQEEQVKKSQQAAKESAKKESEESPK